MLKQKSSLILSVCLAVALLLGIWPTQGHAQQRLNENFIFVNYIGQDVILDLDDVTYTVPGTAKAPEGGRLALQLAEGEHKYAANVPGVPLGSAGEFTIAPGGYVAKAVRLEKTSAILDRNGLVIETPRDQVFIFDFDPFAAPAPTTPVVDLWQPRPAAPGMGSLAWTNYYHDELTVDLNGQLYKVPPAANNLPGRLQIDVSPALYRYTASVPYGSLNGELNVVPGQVTGLTISAKLQPEPRYDIGEPSPLPLPVDLLLFQEDLTAQTVSAAMPDAAPGELPLSGGVLPEAGVNQEGLLVKNYAGDTLIFTINNQIYTLPDSTSQTLLLPPGHYNYTASLPFVATTGTVDLAAGQSLELSVAINVGHDVLNVYQN